MLIAHLPAGVLLTRVIVRRPLRLSNDWIGLLGAVFPDFDILYFYLIDGRKHLHHTYWTHVPIFWLLVLMLFALLWRTMPSWKFPRSFIYLFLPNVFLHLVLDSIAAKILWLYPFCEHPFGLFVVPDVYSHWIYNFLFHWTFLLELALILAAGILLFVDRRVSSRTGSARFIVKF